MKQSKAKGELKEHNFYLNLDQLRRNSGFWFFKEEFQASQVGKGFLFCSPLAGYIHFKAWATNHLPSRQTTAEKRRFIISHLR
jgi:hypothetical protein